MENGGYDIIGKVVYGIIDRPAGSRHPDFPDNVYPINYGYVENVFAGDGEEQDVYILGTNEPLKRFKGEVIAVYHRINDVEDKWIVSVDGKEYSDEEILDIIHFQEQYFEGYLIRRKFHKYYYLHIEGMDLAGKSTVANIIKSQSGEHWTIYNNCLSQNNVIQKFEKQIRNQKIYDDEIYGYLHYVTLLADIKYFELKENVIQDSMLLLRSINYHKEQNNNDLVKLFEEMAPKHPIPDLSVYLTSKIDSRKKRLLKRQKWTKNDKLIFTDSERFEKRDNGLMELSCKYFNSTVINTSDMTETETADYIMTLLKNGSGGD